MTLLWDSQQGVLSSNTPNFSSTPLRVIHSQKPLKTLNIFTCFYIKKKHIALFFLEDRKGGKGGRMSFKPNIRIRCCSSKKSGNHWPDEIEASKEVGLKKKNVWAFEKLNPEKDWCHQFTNSPYSKDLQTQYSREQGETETVKTQISHKLMCR